MMKWALDLLVQLQHLWEMLGDNGVYVMNLISEYGLNER